VPGTWGDFEAFWGTLLSPDSLANERGFCCSSRLGPSVAPRFPRDTRAQRRALVKPCAAAAGPVLTARGAGMRAELIRHPEKQSHNLPANCLLL